MKESIPLLYDNGIKCLYPIVNDECTFICYYPNFLNRNEKNNLEKWLNSKTYKEGKSISGKEIPRLQLWYQQEKKYFNEKWKYRYDRWQSEKYNNLLLKLYLHLLIKI